MPSDKADQIMPAGGAASTPGESAQEAPRRDDPGAANSGPCGPDGRICRLIAGLYILLLVYSSFYPFMDWRLPEEGVFANFLDADRWYSRADILINYLVYIPVGIIAWRLAGTRFRGIRRFGAAIVAGFLLSLTVEWIQVFIHSRVSSLKDLTTNSMGGVTGVALAAVFSPGGLLGRSLWSLRLNLVRGGRLADVGLGVFVIWIIAELSPFLPTLRVSNIRRGAAPMLDWIESPRAPDLIPTLGAALEFAAVGALLATLLCRNLTARLAGLVFVAGVLLLKIPVVTIALHPREVAGWLLAVPLALLFRERRNVALWGGLLVAGAVVMTDYFHAPGAAGETISMNWIPFRKNFLVLGGLADIPGQIWPYAALAYFTRLVFGDPAGGVSSEESSVPACDRERGLESGLESGHESGRRLVVGGAFAVALFAFGAEIAQCFLPGRYPDITDVLLAVTAWLLVWAFPGDGVRLLSAGSASGRGASLDC